MKNSHTYYCIIPGLNWIMCMGIRCHLEDFPSAVIHRDERQERINGIHAVCTPYEFAQSYYWYRQDSLALVGVEKMLNLKPSVAVPKVVWCQFVSYFFFPLDNINVMNREELQHGKLVVCYKTLSRPVLRSKQSFKILRSNILIIRQLIPDLWL